MYLGGGVISIQEVNTWIENNKENIQEIQWEDSVLWNDKLQPKLEKELSSFASLVDIENIHYV